MALGLGRQGPGEVLPTIRPVTPMLPPKNSVVDRDHPDVGPVEAGHERGQHPGAVRAGEDRRPGRPAGRDRSRLRTSVPARPRVRLGSPPASRAT